MNLISQRSPEETWENNERSVRIIGRTDGIRASDRPNTNLKPYRCINIFDNLIEDLPTLPVSPG
jgi:hypothetical protein